MNKEEEVKVKYNGFIIFLFIIALYSFKGIYNVIIIALVVLYVFGIEYLRMKERVHKV